MVAREGIQRSIHDEMAALQRLRFDYRDKMVRLGAAENFEETAQTSY